jgi:magnesium and cobalt transporter
MPDGERSPAQQKISHILSKLFSFFYYKNNSDQDQQNDDNDKIAETMSHCTDYQNLKAKDIMIPRSDIAAVDHSESLEEITQSFLENRHTRMPVYRNDLDDIVGFINIKDILPYVIAPKDNPEFKIDEILHKLLIIPPSMKTFDLLEKMRQARTHISLVVDEFGGADGLITIEDLVEEIVGEIEDEHDKYEDDENEFKEIDKKRFEVNGRMEIEFLEEKLGLSLSENEENEKYDTVSGLILSISGSIPKKGKKIIHPSTGLVFEILESDPRRIKKILVCI